jgi:hypothetical protein
MPFTWVSHEFDVDMYLLPYMTSNIVGHNYEVYHRGGSNGAYVHVNMNDQSTMIESVKVSCFEIATTLCVELSRRFHDAEIMLTFGIVYS